MSILNDANKNQKRKEMKDEKENHKENLCLIPLKGVT